MSIIDTLNEGLVRNEVIAEAYTNDFKEVVPEELFKPISQYLNKYCFVQAQDATFTKVEDKTSLVMTTHSVNLDDVSNDFVACIIAVYSDHVAFFNCCDPEFAEIYSTKGEFGGQIERFKNFAQSAFNKMKIDESVVFTVTMTPRALEIAQKRQNTKRVRDPMSPRTQYDRNVLSKDKLIQSRSKKISKIFEENSERIKDAIEHLQNEVKGFDNIFAGVMEHGADISKDYSGTDDVCEKFEKLLSAIEAFKKLACFSLDVDGDFEYEVEKINSLVKGFIKASKAVK